MPLCWDERGSLQALCRKRASWHRRMCQLGQLSEKSTEIIFTAVPESVAETGSAALIVHEGPSVFRIFHRWQAVNQKWKVLNYDKKRDSDELKASESEWTLSLMQEQAGEAVSPSTSSLLAAAAAVSPDTPNAAAASAAAQDSAHSHGNGAVVTDHHCPYNFLYLLSHLRPHELRSQPSNTSSSSSHQPRELVMRVTTV